MIDFVTPGVRKAAVTAIGQFCRAMAKISKQTQSEETYSGIYFCQ